MSDVPTIEKTIQINSLVICKGETLTVYLTKNNKFAYHRGEGETVLLEMRVNKKGKFELFCDDDIEVQYFNEWYNDV